MHSEKVEFPGSSGAMLAGRLDWPLGTPLAFALFAHCFTCSKDLLAATRLAAGLTERGFAVLRFDFTGLGSSEGEFANTNFSSNVGDLAAAADWLRAKHQAPRLLIGHSLGGTAVLMAAGRIAEAAAVATIGAPSDPAHVTHFFARQVPEVNARGEAQVTLAGRTFTVRKQFLEDAAAQPLHAAVHGLRKALLILHAPQDETVAVDHARVLYDAALHPKSFISLHGADHLLTRREDAAYAAEVLAAWAARYVLPPRPEYPRAGEGTVQVASAGPGPLPQLISAHGHLLRADEPLRNGGTDTGPSPYDLLLASLGS